MTLVSGRAAAENCIDCSLVAALRCRSFIPQALLIDTAVYPRQQDLRIRRSLVTSRAGVKRLFCSLWAWITQHATSCTKQIVAYGRSRPVSGEQPIRSTDIVTGSATLSRDKTLKTQCQTIRYVCIHRLHLRLTAPQHTWWQGLDHTSSGGGYMPPAGGGDAHLCIPAEFGKLVSTKPPQRPSCTSQKELGLDYSSK